MTHTVQQTRVQSSRSTMYDIIVSENTARVCVRCTWYSVRRTMYDVQCTRRTKLKRTYQNIQGHAMLFLMYNLSRTLYTVYITYTIHVRLHFTV